MALQAENYSLERQLFSYQKSISIVNSRGQVSEDSVANDEEAVEEAATPFYDRHSPVAPQGEEAKYI